MTNRSHYQETPCFTHHQAERSSRRRVRRHRAAVASLLLATLASLGSHSAALLGLEKSPSASGAQVAAESELGKSETAAASATTLETPTVDPPLPTTRSDLATYLRQLSDEQRQELAAKQQQFNQLPATEKERLRALHAKIQTDPNAQELNQVLQEYAVWLSSLPLKERSAIQDMKAEDRIERIRELRRREQDSRLTELGLTNRDTQTILDWIQTMVVEHEEELVKLLSPEEKKWRDDSNTPDERRGMMFLRPDRLNDLLKLITAAEYNRLADQLLSSAQSRLLATSGDEKERTKLMTTWIHASFMTRFRPPEVSEEKLLEFLEKLDPSVREELESLPRDRFIAELRNRYNMMQRNRWGPRNGRRGDGRRGGRNRWENDRPGDREGGRPQGFGPNGRDGRPPGPDEGGPPFRREGGPFGPDFGPPPEGPPPEGPPRDEPPPDEHDRRPRRPRREEPEPPPVNDSPAQESPSNGKTE